MSDAMAALSRWVLLPAKELHATYNSVSHVLTLEAEGTAHTVVYGIQFVPMPSRPGQPLRFALKAWSTALPMETPYTHEQKFRMLQPNPMKAIITTEGGDKEIDIELIVFASKQQMQATTAVAAPNGSEAPEHRIPYGPGPVKVPTNENTVYTKIGSNITVTEAIKGGSVRMFYDRDFLDLIGATVDEDMIHYEFKALKLGSTEVLLFRSGSEPTAFERLVDVTIFLPDIPATDAVLEFLGKLFVAFRHVQAKYADAKLLSVSATPTVAIPVEDVSRLNEFRLLCGATNATGTYGTVTAVSIGGAPPFRMDFGPPIVGLDEIDMPPKGLIGAEEAQKVVHAKKPGMGFFELALAKPMIKDPAQPWYAFHMEDGTTVSVGAKDGKEQDW